MSTFSRGVRVALVTSLVSTPLAALNAQTSKACWIVTPREAAQILGKPELANGNAMHEPGIRRRESVRWPSLSSH